MYETESLITRLQRLYFETEDRSIMNQLHDVVEIVSWLEELYEFGYSENAC